MISAPYASCVVVTAGQEVVTKGPPCYIPNGLIMAFVDDKTGPGVERPEADGLVGRT